jgi:peptidoglycan biosynthesis protein MviN/MurJ (putative lipid II flippase)
VLNGLGRFAAAAFAPTLLNVVLIGVLWALLAADLAWRGGGAGGGSPLAWSLAALPSWRWSSVIFIAPGFF